MIHLIVMLAPLAGCAADDGVEVDGRRLFRDPQSGQHLDAHTGQPWQGPADRRRADPDGTYDDPLKREATLSIPLN